jgi:flagellar biosynthesis protein FliP
MLKKNHKSAMRGFASVVLCGVLTLSLGAVAPASHPIQDATGAMSKDVQSLIASSLERMVLDPEAKLLKGDWKNSMVILFHRVLVPQKETSDQTIDQLANFLTTYVFHPSDYSMINTIRAKVQAIKSMKDNSVQEREQRLKELRTFMTYILNTSD